VKLRVHGDSEEMASSNDDVGVEARRTRRRMKVRKSTKTTTSAGVGDADLPDNVDTAAVNGVEGPDDVGPARQDDDLTDSPAPAEVPARYQQTPTITINGSTTDHRCNNRFTFLFLVRF